jgi:uncharacterized phage-associated protein
MTYSAKAIANLLIDIAAILGKRLDQMKLQKLVYIMHGWNLAINDEPLINSRIEAWQYGPLIPELYSEFSVYGRNPITKPVVEYSLDNDLNLIANKIEILADDNRTRELAENIFQIYGHLSGPQLSNLTHQTDTPWEKAFNISRKSEISDDCIKEHFKHLAVTRSVS